MIVDSYLIEAHIFREIENDLEFLLLKRAEGEIYAGVWQMVTGKIKEGEKAFESAIREIKEETAISPINFWVAPLVNSFYDHTKNTVCMVPVFAARADNESIVKISDEHSEFKWVKRDEAKKMLAWDGQRKSVDLIFEYFTKERSVLNFVEIFFKQI